MSMEIEVDRSKRGVGKTALIVDDNSMIRKTVVSAFLSGGFQTCEEAENGQEGVELATEIKPDVIVLDFSMPVLNGLNAALEIRKTLPSVPIILFTLYADCVSDRELSRAGINAVMPKTVAISVLVDMAHEVMLTR